MVSLPQRTPDSADASPEGGRAAAGDRLTSAQREFRAFLDATLNRFPGEAPVTEAEYFGVGLNIDVAALDAVTHELLLLLAARDRRGMSDLRAATAGIPPGDRPAFIANMLAVQAGQERVCERVRREYGQARERTVRDSYASLRAVSLLVAEEIVEMERAASRKPSLRVDDLYRRQMDRFTGMLEEILSSETEADAQAVLERIRGLFSEGRVAMQITADLTSALPGAAARAAIDVPSLETVDLRVEPGAALLEPGRADLLREMQRIIREGGLPDGDDVLFQEELADPRLRVCRCELDGKLLGFFTVKRMANGMLYVDWFHAGPHHVQLAEAFVISALRRLDEGEGIYFVAQTHVPSLRIAVEGLDAVGLETTVPGEYKRRYLRCVSLTPDEMNRCVGKNLTDAQLAEVRALCDASPGKAIVWQAEGRELLLTRVTVRKEDAEFREYGLLDRLGGMHAWAGYVLTRYIPQTDKPGNRTYYCVAEPDFLDERRMADLPGAIVALHSPASGEDAPERVEA